jgi:hypothetical protein
MTPDVRRLRPARRLAALLLATTCLTLLAPVAAPTRADDSGDRFDLRCEIVILGADPTTHEIRVYAIDLVARRWSRVEPDAEVNQIKEVTDSEIVLSDSTSADGQSRFLQVIERYSGKFHGLVRSPPQGRIEAGDCTRQPFTGFPQKKF